jgi:transposase
LVAEQPDLTLDEIVAAMRARRIAGSRSAVWRLFARHGISFKKVCERRSKSEPSKADAVTVAAIEPAYRCLSRSARLSTASMP